MQVKCSDMGGDCDTVFEDRDDLISAPLVATKCPVCGASLDVPAEF